MTEPMGHHEPVKCLITAADPVCGRGLGPAVILCLGMSPLRLQKRRRDKKSFETPPFDSSQAKRDSPPPERHAVMCYARRSPHHRGLSIEAGALTGAARDRHIMGILAYCFSPTSLGSQCSAGRASLSQKVP